MSNKYTYNVPFTKDELFDCYVNKKMSQCEICGTTDADKSYDWANLTGKYDDPSDYKRMCRSCHAKQDRVILNIGKMRERYLNQ